MFSSKFRASAIVFALLLVTSMFAVGCSQQQKGQGGWVNTNSMPGHTFTQYRKYVKSDAKQSNSTIVYLGSKDDESNNANFGPRDVNFEFRNLK